MKSLKGTKTEKNILLSFAGESQAGIDTAILHLRPKKKAMSR
jgi:hypothetical protein